MRCTETAIYQEVVILNFRKVVRIYITKRVGYSLFVLFSILAVGITTFNIYNSPAHSIAMYNNSKSIWFGNRNYEECIIQQKPKKPSIIETTIRNIQYENTLYKLVMILLAVVTFTSLAGNWILYG